MSNPFFFSSLYSINSFSTVLDTNTSFEPALIITGFNSKINAIKKEIIFLEDRLLLKDLKSDVAALAVEVDTLNAMVIRSFGASNKYIGGVTDIQKEVQILATKIDEKIVAISKQKIPYTNQVVDSTATVDFDWKVWQRLVSIKVKRLKKQIKKLEGKDPKHPDLPGLKQELDYQLKRSARVQEYRCNSNLTLHKIKYEQNGVVWSSWCVGDLRQSNVGASCNGELQVNQAMKNTLSKPNYSVLEIGLSVTRNNYEQLRINFWRLLDDPLVSENKTASYSHGTLFIAIENGKAKVSYDISNYQHLSSRYFIFGMRKVVYCNLTELCLQLEKDINEVIQD